jgi:hypothetical protein
MLQSFQAEFPNANEEVKIVLPISLVGHRLLSTNRTMVRIYNKTVVR